MVPLEAGCCPDPAGTPALGPWQPEASAETGARAALSLRFTEGKGNAQILLLIN
jgi:hypothetical protein